MIVVHPDASRYVAMPPPADHVDGVVGVVAHLIPISFVKLFQERKSAEATGLVGLFELCVTFSQI